MKKTAQIVSIFSLFLFICFPAYAQVLSPPGISPNGSVFTMDEKDGILYLGGSFKDVGYLTGGSAYLPGHGEIPDLTFPHINGEVYAIISDGAGGWFLGGEFDNVDVAPRSNIVHILADRTIDMNFNISINKQVNALALKDNLLVIGGKFTMVDNMARNYVATYDLQSWALTSFNPSPNQEVKTIEVYKNTIIIGGFFSQVSGEDQPRIAQIDINTGQNIALPVLPIGFVYDLLLAGDTLIAGGDFAGGLFAIDLTTNTKINWNAAVSGFGFGQSVNALAIVDTVVYFGGSFSKVNNENRSDMAAVSLNGNLMPFNPGPDGKVTAIFADGDSLFVGGEFIEISNSELPHLAKISRTTGQASTWKPEPNWAIHGIIFRPGEDLGDILIAGQINMLHRIVRDNACAIDIATGKVTDWNPQPKFLTVSSLFVDQFQEVVYMAGWDSKESRHFKAVNIVDGKDLIDWHNSFDNAVNDIDQDTATGDIYIGGKFTTINGESQSRLAAFKPNGNLVNLNTNIDNEVRDIAFSTDHNMLYFAGKFENVNNQPRNMIAAINNLGILQDWSVEIHNNFSDVSLGVFDFITTKDKIYICGNLNTVNGEERDMIAAIHPLDGSLLPYNPSIEAKDIHTMEPAGDGIFIAGTDLKKVGNTAVNTLAYIGANSGLVLKEFTDDFGGPIHSMIHKDSLLFLGGNFLNLNQKHYGRLISYSGYYEATVATGGLFLEKSFPKEGGNTGSVTIEIIGSGFEAGTSVKLTGQGFEDILFSPDSSQISQNRILAHFNLRNIPVGSRTLEVLFPKNDTILSGGAFRIVEGTEAMPWADVVTPYFVTARKEEFFYLSYGNKGNIDATGVPVWLAVSPNIEIKNIDFKMFDIFDSSSPFYDSIPEYVLVDSLAGKPNPAKVYGFIIPKIEALSSKVVRFTIKGSDSGDFYTRAWANRPLFGSPLKYSIGECADTWITNAVGFIPVVGCSFNIADVVLTPMFDYAYDPDFGSSNWAGNYMELVASTGIGCAAEVFTGGFGGAVVHVADQALKAKSTVDLLTKCYPAEDKENSPGEFVASCDPNDKSGLPGRGSKGWISTDKRFPYMIRFENDPEATAPAKQVIIRDTLDTSVFDLNSLQLKGFAIADSFYIIPSGFSEHKMTIDLRPRLPYHVESEVTLNNSSGLLTWTFTTLDPDSNTPVTDPLGGFLPPSIDTLSGQGAIFFDVAVHDTITNGREINNLASIYFDFNDPIITNNWKLTADNGGPNSSVSKLSEKQTETDIHLEWSGSDSGSGILYYDVLFRKDKGEWLYANVQTKETSMTFTGEMNAEYEFFTIAYDSALNIEEAPSLADARVLISNEVTGLTDKLEKKPFEIFPNPTSSILNIHYKEEISNLNLHLITLTGKSVVHLNSFHGDQIDLTFLPTGIYILKWQATNKNGQLKIVKN